ncbi:hypothetical protein OK016_25290 [Vibrio chagasii]|nr:hypothetical protein [Vibrio chagasii]
MVDVSVGRQDMAGHYATDITEVLRCSASNRCASDKEDDVFLHTTRWLMPFS